MIKDQEYLDKLRHSTAHLLAAAVLEIFPKALLAIGPSIPDGFYYDIDFGRQKISEADLPKIEAKMREMVASWKGFKRYLLTARQAKAEYGPNPYKHELIDEFSKGNKKVGFYKSVGSKSSAYKSGEYWDLCKGGHINSPAIELKYFKLLSIAGAYWRGSEKNPMLTRIYGTAWPTKKELDDYLTMLAEARKRDHKKLGPALELFMFHETAPGSPYWLPKGLIIFNKLLEFWREEHAKRGYLETSTPLINKKSLWETSGHWQHYKDSMFVADMGEEEVYGVKAMNCPNAMVIFGSKTRSYRDLPLRLSDSDILHRYERSGELNGLFRVRMFRQDDSHNFVTEAQIEKEYDEILKIVALFYGVFELSYKLRLGTRPEKYMGSIKTWNKAEASLRKILDKHVGSGKYLVAEGDGAFYGPKIDIILKDSLGRDWQMGTVQLDFQQPASFKLKYVDSDGSQKTPIAIHRVIYGSIERFIGILIEHFAGAFPVWLAPVQVMILPITERNIRYAKVIGNKLQETNIRVEVDERSETLPAKIRDAQLEKVPYMVIVGEKEEKSKSISLRLRSGEDLGKMSVDNLIKRVAEKNLTKSLGL